MTEVWPTAFTELVGCRLPIQQAGMDAVSTVALAAAVAEAGGLGMIAPHGASPDRVVADLRAVADATAGAFGINFLIPFVRVSAVEAAAGHSRYIEFFYGQPDADLVNRASANGARVGWQVGSADEAAAAVDAGCDLVIAQGTEGGGHIRGTLGLLPTLDAVLDRVDVPVVAAGRYRHTTRVRSRARRRRSRCAHRHAVRNRCRIRRASRVRPRACSPPMEPTPSSPKPSARAGPTRPPWYYAVASTRHPRSLPTKLRGWKLATVRGPWSGSRPKCLCKA